MKILIASLFFFILLASVNCQNNTVLRARVNLWIERKLIHNPIGTGIAYYENEDKKHTRIDESGVNVRVKIGPYIVGVNEHGILLPIFDDKHRHIIVTQWDDANYQLPESGARLFPFHREFEYVTDIIRTIYHRMELWNVSYW